MNLTPANCPSKGTYLTNCLSNNDLTDDSVCTKEERIKMVTHNFQCDLLQNIPSSQVSFENVMMTLNYIVFLSLGMVMIILILMQGIR